MSRAPELPKPVSDALLAVLKKWIEDWRREQNKSRGGQTELAALLGYPEKSGQAAIDAALRRGTVGAAMAERIFAHIVPREVFLAQVDGRPMPPADISFVALRSWIAETRGVALVLKKYAEDITTFDLLRLHANPLRHGENEPEEIYRHIQQLRRGSILDVPGDEVAAAEVDRLSRAARARAKKPG